MKVPVLLTVVSLALVGCTGDPPASPLSSPPLEDPASPAATEPFPTAALPSIPSLPRVSPSAAPITGEVPRNVLQPMLEAAAEAAGVDVGQVDVIRAERATWSDGALGCPEPGMVYPQVIVDGYWVIVAAGDEMYDFRADDRGNFKLCPPGRGGPPIG